MEARTTDVGNNNLYYAVQVAPGTEARTEALIRGKVDSRLYGCCFHPMRHMRKKFHGEWRDVHEKLIPGYVFVTSASIRELYAELQRVPALTKLLGKSEGGLFIPLPASEAEWLEQLMAGGTEVPLSRILVSEGDRITILSGPLKDLEGRIKKINLHKRMAEVEVNFMNQGTVLHLGIEMIRKETGI